MNKQQLLDLKGKIDEAQQEVSRQEGAQEDALKQLREHGANNVEEAQAEIERLDSEIEKVQEDLEGKANDLQAKLDEVE